MFGGRMMLPAIALLGAAAMVQLSLPAGAMPLAPGDSVSSPVTLVGNGNKNKNKNYKYKYKYKYKYNGKRYKYRRSGFNYFYGGFYYPYPWWTGATVYSGPSYVEAGPDDGDAHVAWCIGHYRSYVPATDTFTGYDGLQHECNSPYDY